MDQELVQKAREAASRLPMSHIQDLRLELL